MRRPKGAIVCEYRKLWWTLIGVLTVTFAILGFSGVEIYRQVPPVPERVVSASGDVLMTRSDILDGQTARSEERRVGKECVRTCRSRGSPSHSQKKYHHN